MPTINGVNIGGDWITGEQIIAEFERGALLNSDVHVKCYSVDFFDNKRKVCFSYDINGTGKIIERWLNPVDGNWNRDALYRAWWIGYVASWNDRDVRHRLNDKGEFFAGKCPTERTERAA